MEELLQAVKNEPVQAEAFEAVADHLMGLGYAALAARWRSWALLPPEASQREAAVEDLRKRLVSGAQESRALLRSVNDAETDPELLLRQAQSLLEGGQTQGARLVITRLARLTGLPPALCHQAGQLAREAGEPAEAERWFRTGLRQAPGQPLPWFALARVLLDLEASDEALAAAEQGLQLAPGHRWGRNLRMLALESRGAGRTLVRLAEVEGLPDLPRTAGVVEGFARRLKRLEQRRWPEVPPLPLGVRLELHRRLASRPSLWVVLHGRGAGPLARARSADLLPQGLRLQPLASRDPFGLRQSLEGFPLELLAEKPARVLTRLPPLGLAIVHRDTQRALPHRLRGLLERDVPLLAPVGLFSAEALRIGVPKQTWLRHGGWELLWPETL
ncbi:MAG: tetratricopeptide repeat protein [Cyanobacteriota bacterium]|jgi:tetratricopeptide (TPR) repeat protein